MTIKQLEQKRYDDAKLMERLNNGVSNLIGPFEVKQTLDDCWCGAPAQWYGDLHGLRVFACRKCATQQGAE